MASLRYPTPVSAPASRLVLLGASNLRFSLPLVVDLARRRLGGPLEVLAAPGEGRSYGGWSRFLWRELPGVVDCGLWSRLHADGRPTYALLADVGNDVAFGVPPARIAGWVETCLERLRRVGARSALVLFPAASVARLGPLRFHFLRRLLFPGRRVTRAYVNAAAAELNQRLREVARSMDVPALEPPAAWYGLDAIHIRRRARAAAWSACLDALGADLPPGEAGGRRPHALRFARHAQRRVLGRDRRCVQPVACLADGTTVEVY
jgi:hypothetical protein